MGDHLVGCHSHRTLEYTTYNSWGMVSLEAQCKYWFRRCIMGQNYVFRRLLSHHHKFEAVSRPSKCDISVFLWTLQSFSDDNLLLENREWIRCFFIFHERKKVMKDPPLLVTPEPGDKCCGVWGDDTQGEWWVVIQRGIWKLWRGGPRGPPAPHRQAHSYLRTGQEMKRWNRSS